MSISVNLHPGPLVPVYTNHTPGAGATLLFEGWVRPLEDEKAITALNYEVYEPMTSQELFKLASRYLIHYELHQIIVHHSHGHVPIHQCSFQLMIASAHRKEAITAMDAFINEMKQTIPIWKVPVYQ